MAKPSPESIVVDGKHKIGMIVVFTEARHAGRLGKITEAFFCPRPQHVTGRLFGVEKSGPEQVLYHVHYFDSKTGRLMYCPDFARCHHRHTCPIHGDNVWAEDIAPLPEPDLEFYRAEGLIVE